MYSGIQKSSIVIDEVKKAIIGKDDLIIKIMAAILAKGHILIEDIPGVGKTTLAMAFSRALSLKHRRMQFTPDVMPSDVTGFTIYNKETQKFAYRPGSVMCNLFLADEINRTSSKTQSALLEAMEEGRVTVDGITRELPKPFIVIATQNPAGAAGTQLLPESQMDRFMVRLSMGYPDKASEIGMLKGRLNDEYMDAVQKIITSEELLQIQNEVEQIYVHDKVYEYIVHLVSQTREHGYIQLGMSPRGTIALLRMSKAIAYLNDRTYMIPDDVRSIFYDVAAHRLLLSSKARINSVDVPMIIRDILQKTKTPVFKE